MYYEFDDYFEPGEFDEKIEELKNELRAVSYTHLTLPTIA